VSTDSGGISDDVIVELNPGPESPAVDQPPPISERPADSADESEWVDYVVALGAGRDVAEDTHHWDATAGEYVTVPALNRDDLIALADRLSGTTGG
jgi:hypothetical protein